jgi:plasmid stabilization system protein ParE
MNRTIHRRQRAREDVMQQYSYYLLQGGYDLAERYLNEFEETIARLLEQPKIGARRDLPSPQLSGVCMQRVRGFDHEYIFYRPREDGIEIIRVLRDQQNVADILEEEIS